jgi:SAM-dependent methyltransferase
MPQRELWEERLDRFYASSGAYHEMTASHDKAAHPQVRLLSSLLSAGGTYAETGCGGGAACAVVAQTASVVGFDVSPIALEIAGKRCEGLPAEFHMADAGAIPLPDSSVDGAYSFEVMEHLWDPISALREMSRITKPGGFLLVSTPNHFSLDLHLPKKRCVLACEIPLGVARAMSDRCTGRLYVNLVPDLDEAGPFPDCDMVTSLIPCNIEKSLAGIGCSLVFLDTFYMQSISSWPTHSLRFQRCAGIPVLKWMGDHILFLARKNAAG